MLCEFQSHCTLKKPDTKVEFNAIVAVLLFIFGLSLLGSRFILSPGVKINIPKVQNIDLQATSGVFNVGLNGLLIFNNQILKLEAVPEAVGRFLAHKKFPEMITLLVCIDKSVPFGFVTQVVDALKSAKCCNIQIACDS
jgi:biopolymer transport protein ExbD